MSRSISSPIHQAMVGYLISARKEAGMTQAAVAEKLGRHQSFVATVEAGQRRIDVVELFEFAWAIGFSPQDAMKTIERLSRSYYDEAQNLLNL